MTQSSSRIRALRLERDWSQADLARRAHVSKRTLERIEKGGTPPTARQLVNLALALGCDLYAVMDDAWLVFFPDGDWPLPNPSVLPRPEGDVPPRIRRERAPRRSKSA